MADINEIVSKAGINSVVKARDEIEKTNLAIQDTILNAKSLSDTLAGAKTMGAVNKSTQDLAKSQEQLLKLTAQRQLSEEKLAAFHIREAQRAEQAAAKKLAAEQKQLELDNKRIAALERKANAQFKADSTVTNGATIASGTTVTPVQQAEALAASQAASIPSIQQNTKATEENAAAKKRLAFEALQAKESERQNAAALKNSVKEANAAKGSLDQRRLALTRLRATFDGLNEAERNTPFGQRLAKTIPQLNEQVLTLEKSTGRAQRNVGNYGNAFQQAAGKAWSGLKMIANILPGLGIAGLIGFALDPLIEYVSQLDAVKKSTEALATETAIASSEYKKAVSDVTALGTSLKEYNDGTISRTEVVKRYNETIGQTVGQLKTVDEVEAFYNNQSANFVKATLMRAQAQAALNIATDKATKAIDRQASGPTAFDFIKGALQNILNPNAIGKSVTNAVQSQTDAITDLNKGAEDAVESYQKLQQAADEFAKKNGLNFRANEKDKAQREKIDKAAIAAVESQIKIAQEQQKIYQDQLSNENFSYESRLNALTNFTERSNRIAELEAEKAKAGRKLSNNEIMAIDQERATKETEIAIDAGNKLIKINQDQAKLVEGIRVFRNEKAIADLENQRDTELAVLASSFNQRGVFTEQETEKYEKQRLAVINKYALEEVKQLFQQQQQLIDIRKANGEDTSKEEARLAELRLKYQDLQFSNSKDLASKEIDAEKKKQQIIRDLLKETYDFAQTLANGIFEGNISRLEKEKELATEKKDIDIENVEESLLSEEQKAERIKIINSQAEADQKQLDARIAAEKRKQAIANKIFALGQIAIQTAMAAAAVLAPPPVGLGPLFGASLLPFVIAQGAIQAATVLATPIPEFRHGGTMKHDGLAQFGEVGSELRINPDGTKELTPDRTTVGFVKKGTRFVTAAETKRLLGKPEQLDYAGKSWDVAPLIAESRRSSDEMKKAVSKLTTPSTLITKNGFHSQNIKTAKLNSYLKKNLS